ncbi:hypothetical protein EF847_01440 [Actinobacteria bacterium YIM 96077]|uniref:Uncharacterized protein n=1 Tax=Phytoactinopolyspora halophila TaxID=1981511 RepID=A0A329QFQ4_9ACTN|nr:hypothetical protein EF847_01440 [Actinobacteria bacterium YIM 96077]RAW11130.1 hypothetical protein DPM12_17465 [Phytoactinopolyspora halophila]
MVETSRGYRGLFAAAEELTDPPEFVQKDNSEPKAEKPKSTKPAKKAPPKKTAPKKAFEETEVQEPSEVSNSLEAKIASAADGDALKTLYRLNKARWTNEHTELARKRREELEIA